MYVKSYIVHIFIFLQALDFIHDLGVAHFDVKLENIQIGYDGLYKLSDFGLVYNFQEASIFR